MSLQGLATALLLPPLALVLLALAGGLLAARGWRPGGALAALAALALLALATPAAEGTLRWSLEREAEYGPPPPSPPGAVIVLGAEMTRGAAGPDLGPLTLERLRAGAALARATGLPLLVTGGPLGRDQPPIAELMAAALARDFGLPPRWVEPRAADTAGNALLSAEMLREAGIGSAFVVSHGWHLPRARGAFARAGLPAVMVPVRGALAPGYRLSDFIPRADHLAGSAWAIREWAGRAVYAVRDGRD
jgi:uncharacterized SAM-binding protein YcdF (DUF218 family)